jgi:ABC-type transport system substrate-binding protein
MNVRERRSAARAPSFVFLAVVVSVLTACTATPAAAPPAAQPTVAPAAATQPTTAPAAAAKPTTATAAAAPTTAPAAAAKPTTAPAAAAGASSDAILRVGISAPLNSLKPVGLQQTDMTYNRAIYDALVNVGPHGTLLPHLATSWDVSSDGLTLTLHLKSGVTFQNGAPLTADSVVAMITWAQDPANAMDATTVLKGMTVSASDPMTVVIKMTRPAAAELLPTLVTLPIADVSSGTRRRCPRSAASNTRCSKTRPPKSLPSSRERSMSSPIRH